ncbi:hypothetical protein TNCV_1976951 [Trichonephila clavipes]|nr:hypothetical protein TNCV_1976951 [Trichonephila clavipes]
MKTISILLCAAVLMVAECAPTLEGGINVSKAEAVELGVGGIGVRAGYGVGAGLGLNAGRRRVYADYYYGK